MCIRDRANTAAVAEGRGVPTLVEFFSTALAERLVSEGVRPVSYTHLRAHETVLDLVCRLLLEKKHNMVLMCFTSIKQINNHTRGSYYNTVS